MQVAVGNRSEPYENAVPGLLNPGAHAAGARIAQPYVGRLALILAGCIPDIHVQAEQLSFVSGAERRAETVGAFSQHENHIRVMNCFNDNENHQRWL
jgi:hypothetical protein